MFSNELKAEIAEKIQAVLQEVDHKELQSDGQEINFLLHIDGKEGWSWANIQNNGNRYGHVPMELIKNTTA